MILIDRKVLKAYEIILHSKAIRRVCKMADISSMYFYVRSMVLTDFLPMLAIWLVRKKKFTKWEKC